MSNLFNQVIRPNNNIEQLCNPYIESNDMKIVKHKKMTVIT